MSRSPIIAKLEQTQMKKDIPEFDVGDTVSVHFRVIEGNKERVQVFTGTVIARKGCGIGETFSLHRVAYGEGMERVFPLHSPRIAKIVVMKKGKVRRSKLYYLRGTSGKAAKVKGRIVQIRSKLATNGSVPVEAEEVEDIRDNGAEMEIESQETASVQNPKE